MQNQSTRVLIWNENIDEQRIPDTLRTYPQGIHGALREFLSPAFDAITATWGEDDTHGLSGQRLDETDVLLWYSHWNMPIDEETYARILRRVMAGMGVIFLHSGVLSQLHGRLVGPCSSGVYREVGEIERLWVVNRAHPILDGLPDHIDIPQSEMYPEPRDIPSPDELLTISWYEGGEVLRSGYTYTRGAGRIFCFLPGHSTFPIYRQPEIQQLLVNAVRWCAPRPRPPVQSRKGEVGYDYLTKEHR
jgi:trehalose utilization protein